MGVATLKLDNITVAQKSVLPSFMSPIATENAGEAK